MAKTAGLSGPVGMVAVAIRGIYIRSGYICKRKKLWDRNRIAERCGDAYASGLGWPVKEAQGAPVEREGDHQHPETRACEDRTDEQDLF